MFLNSEKSKLLTPSVRVLGNVRLTLPKVKAGGRYPVGPAQIEVDSIELLPFAAISAADLRRSGEPDREALRRRAAHAGPVSDGTLLYRVEFHLVAEPPQD